MAGLRAPLSTLRRGPHGQPRMTRGRCGSLFLHRKGLAPSTLCRSPGASHIFDVLAKGDNIPVRRMASTASRERPEVSLVLRGKEGSGKESSYARPIGLVADE